MKKRIISFIMALILLVGIMPSISVSVDADVARYWPVPGHRVYAPYSSAHKAIDINGAGVNGAAVIASIGGTVVSTYRCGTQHYGDMHTCSGFGTGLIIKGDDGWYYQYAHMQANSMPGYVQNGAYIAAGQRVGRVGTTGNSSGPHLHFEISTVMWAGDINPQGLAFNDTTVTPMGVVDECTGGEGSIFVRGWSFDEDDISKSLNIHVYIGDERHAYIYADKERPDVNNVYGCGDYHGFSETIKTKLTGTQTVIVYAINAGGSINPVLYKGTVDIKPGSTSGDINNDGVINNKDLALLMQFLNGWPVKISSAFADVNADGAVNNKDYALILQYTNGWNVNLK